MIALVGVFSIFVGIICAIGNYYSYAPHAFPYAEALLSYLFGAFVGILSFIVVGGIALVLQRKSENG